MDKNKRVPTRDTELTMIPTIQQTREPSPIAVICECDMRGSSISARALLNRSWMLRLIALHDTMVANVGSTEIKRFRVRFGFPQIKVTECATRTEA